MYRTPIDIEEEDMPRRRFRHRRAALQSAPRSRQPQPCPTPNLILSANQQAVLALYADMERHRNNMHEAFCLLVNHIQDHPELRQAWDGFIDSGGATENDLRREFQYPRIYPAVARRGQLRVVATNKRRGGLPRIKPNPNRDSVA